MAHRFVARSSFASGFAHGGPGAHGGFARRGSGSHGHGASRGSEDGFSGAPHTLHRDDDLFSGTTAPWRQRPRKRARSLDFPTVAESDALQRRSLLVSKTVTTFARYPDRRPAGVVPAGDGSLDVDQLWVCWGRRCGFSRTQLLQHIADHAISDNGRRRFLLHSDHDGRTWVTVSAPLRRMPRRHRRGSRRVPSSHRVMVTPVACASHVSISSEEDFDDDAVAPDLREEDLVDASADRVSPSEDAMPGDLEHDMKLESVVKTEETPVDECSLAPTVLDAASQTCKTEPHVSNEDAMPSAQVFTLSVPSLSPDSTVDFRGLTPPPGQTPDFREDSPSHPFNEPPPSKLLSCLDPSLTPVLGSPPHPPSTSPSSPYCATPEAPLSPPSPYSVSPTIPDVPPNPLDTATSSPNVVPLPSSPPRPSPSSDDLSPLDPVLVDSSSLSRTGVTSLPGLIFWFVLLNTKLT